MPSDAELLLRATQAAARAYVPYSDFPVGAAILTATGEIYTGCNVENASYGLTLCAERNAATTMITDTNAAQSRIIEAVAIVGLNAAPCWPCGACRQVLREFHTKRVIVEDANNQPQVLDFAEILPHSFGPEHLNQPEEA